MAYEANQTLCETPLPDSEFEFCVEKCTLISNLDTTTRYNNQSPPAYTAPFKELEGSKYYKTNEKPQRFIIAHNQRKQLIEAVARPKPKGSITSNRQYGSDSTRLILLIRYKDIPSLYSYQDNKT